MAGVSIVLLYHQSLFSAGIESRLRTIDGLNIVHVEAVDAAALAQIAALAPDVIIVDLLDRGLAPHSSILQLLNQKIAKKVIGLDLTGKEVHIYRREGRVVLNGADLLAAISEA